MYMPGELATRQSGVKVCFGMTSASVVTMSATSATKPTAIMPAIILLWLYIAYTGVKGVLESNLWSIAQSTYLEGQV